MFRPTASDFYHTAQLLTITDQTEELVDMVASYINSTQFDQSSPRYAEVWHIRSCADDLLVSSIG